MNRRSTAIIIAAFILLAALMTPTADAQAKTRIVSTDHAKYTYKEMRNDMKKLVKRYPEYAKLKVIGRSVQKRKLYDLVIGNPKAKKTLLVTASIHAREYVTSQLVMRTAEDYLINYKKSVGGQKVQNVLNDCNIHIVAMLNPDGVTLAQNGDPQRKTNAAGVDLNGDFHGKYKNRQPETRAIMKLVKTLKKKGVLKGIINYHAMGSVVFGGYSGNNAAVKKNTRRMYNLARGLTGYADAGDYSFGTRSGKTFRDYTNHVTKVASITIEVGRTACPVPFNEYARISQENRCVMLREAALF